MCGVATDNVTKSFKSELVSVSSISKIEGENMKYVALLFLLMSSSLLAKDLPNYFCFERDSQQWVRLIHEGDDVRVRYGQFDSELLNFKMPQSFVELRGDERRTFNFERVGEVYLHIYGRINGEHGLFDIYQIGADVHLESDANTYECREI